MKKLMATTIALALTMSMSLSAFAADNSATLNFQQAGNEKKDIAVNATLTNVPTEAEIYSVDVAWTDMNFTYTQPQDKAWQPDKHNYIVTDVAGGGWDKTEATVTVTNHSNKAVNVQVNFQGVENSGVSGAIDVTSKTLASGVGLAYSAADKLESKLTISGKPAATGQVGTVTVQIAKQSA